MSRKRLREWVAQQCSNAFPEALTYSQEEVVSAMSHAIATAIDAIPEASTALRKHIPGGEEVR